MENQTYSKDVLLLESITVTQQVFYPALVLLVIVYIAIMLVNISVIVLITTDRSLHQPMYILLCNLPFNDMLGATGTLPRLIKDLLTEVSERYITYTECVVQAFCSHVFGTTSHTILMIMAFDRYVAICNPLHYSIIMNNWMVVKLTVFAWGAAFFFVGILLGLTIRLSLCRKVVMNIFCDNAALFKLSCESVVVNNYYGLAFTILLFLSSFASISLTYLKIAIACFRSKNSSVNSKALSTCSAHLLVYIILLFCGLTIITLHRFTDYVYLGKTASVLFNVIAPLFNPIIYGLQTKEIKNRILKAFHKSKVSTW